MQVRLATSIDIVANSVSLCAEDIIEKNTDKFSDKFLTSPIKNAAIR